MKKYNFHQNGVLHSLTMRTLKILLSWDYINPLQLSLIKRVNRQGGDIYL